MAAATTRILKRWLVLASMACFAALAGRDCAPVQAADFELGSPTIELRRLQYCDGCREPLVVTSIAPGAAVRCPKCERVQRRLPDSELEVKVYQICPSCGARLDLDGLKPLDPLKCGSCGLAQRALAEATSLPKTGAGQGRIPDGPQIAPSTPLQEPSPRVLTAPKVPGLNTKEYDAPALAGGTADETVGSSLNRPAGGAAAPSAAPRPGEEKEVDPLPDALAPSTQSLRPAVWVNGVPIPEATVARLLRRNYEIIRLNRYFPGAGKADLPRIQQVRDRIVSDLIDHELLLQAGKKDGIVPQPTAIEARIKSSGGELSEDGAREELVIDELHRRHGGNPRKYSESGLREYYQRNPFQFSAPDRYRLRAIVLYTDRTGRPDMRDAEEIAREIKRKTEFGVDFGALAKRYSEGPFRDDEGTVRSSDEQGLIPADNLAHPIRKLLADFTPGKVVGPVTMPGCLLFLKMDEFRRGELRPFEEVQDEVLRAVRLADEDKAFADWVQSLRRASLIEYPKGVDPVPDPK